MLLCGSTCCCEILCPVHWLVLLHKGGICPAVYGVNVYVQLHTVYSYVLSWECYNEMNDANVQGVLTVNENAFHAK